MFTISTMGVTATTVEIAKGLTMPFLPMRPRIGTPIKSQAQIKSAVVDLEDEKFLIQPSITGMRVCVAVVDKNVFIQDEQGKWISRPPSNGHDLLKLPNNTCLDGFIVRNTFF